MSYTVTWKRTAMERLADIWISTTDRQAVTLAADSLDAVLRADPLHQGEAREGTLRLVIVPPRAAL